MKQEPTEGAEAYYSDILPSGGVPVTQRWTSLLILINTTHAYTRTHTPSTMKTSNQVCCNLPLAPHSVQIGINKSNDNNCEMHSTLSTYTQIWKNYFGPWKIYVQTCLSCLRKTPSILRTMKSHNHFPFFLRPRKSPDSLWFLSVRVKAKQRGWWNSCCASQKGKWGR